MREVGLQDLLVIPLMLNDVFLGTDGDVLLSTVIII